MNSIRYIRRLAAVLAGLAGLAGALLAFTAAPAAFAKPVPPSAGSGAASPPFYPPVQIHTVVMGGMSGWQIALIAIGAALFAATAAVLLDRAVAGRRRAAAATA